MSVKSRVFTYVIALTCLATAVASQTTEHDALARPKGAGVPRRVTVSEPVAVLLRPLLDLRQESVTECGKPGTPSRCKDGEAYERQQRRREQFEQLLHELTQRKGAAADEALVVLMCFYVGESQEETDAVIGRGRRMLGYLNRYRHAIPSIPDRAYPSSMLKERSVKTDAFAGAIRAVRKGSHNTADNPEG